METEQFRGNVAGTGLNGILAVLPGGCLGLAGPGPRDRRLVVFPAGTKLITLRSKVAVSVPDNGSSRARAATVQVGDRILTGSRWGEAVPVTGAGDLRSQTPRGCQDYRAVFLDGRVTLDPRY